MEDSREPGTHPPRAPCPSFPPEHLEREKHSWCGNQTLASARPCACGCQKPVAPLSSPATTSRKVLMASPWRARPSCSPTL
uniref:Ras and Rab interactor 1 n=1 Tax=Sciurus vulgaris TaxID=55149 RepID=A0A8D2B3E3_SCIVU